MTSARRNQRHGPNPTRRRRIGALGCGLIVGLAALSLAGCETIADNTPDVGFTVLEPSKKQEPQAPEVMTNAVKRPVAEVTSLEVGQMRKGRLLTAHGAAATPGWFQPALVPRGERPTPDGFLEFDFVAAPPELNGGAPMPEGTPIQRSIRADRAVSNADLAGVSGLRVYAAGGVAAVRLAP